MPTQELTEVQQIVQELCLMNNKFMNKVFENNIPAAELLLRIILKNDKIKVKEVKVQNFIQNLYGHSAQMDILAQDEAGVYFNVEVQRSDEGAPAKRARFYSSLLDSNLLKAGKQYEQLPVTYVNFITENDVLQGNLPLYDIDRVIKQNGADFGDGTHIVYEDDTPLGRLMQDFYCKDPARMHYSELAAKCGYWKNVKESEADMQDIIEQYAEKRAQKAVAKAEREKNKELVIKLSCKGMSVEEIANILDITEAQVRELAEKRSA